MPLLRDACRLSLSMLAVCAACSRTQPTAEPAPTSAPMQTSAPVATAPSVRGDTSRSQSVREYYGAYSRGWETSWFEPCDAPIDDKLWWVTLTDGALRQRDSLLKALKTRPTGALAVRWRGTLSERMPAGMMGRGTRYLLVTEIVDLRASPGEGACGAATRTSSLGRAGLRNVPSFSFANGTSVAVTITAIATHASSGH
ncbi:MAG TPA: hypothetical protein VGG84_13490 [Gemmatimonadaceae bacterium]